MPFEINQYIHDLKKKYIYKNFFTDDAGYFSTNDILIIDLTLWQTKLRVEKKKNTPGIVISNRNYFLLFLADLLKRYIRDKVLQKRS